MKAFSRGAGLLLPITSLPSAYGIGTLGEAAFRFVDLLVDLRQRYWQVLPLGPTSFGDSPYQALSAFAGNPYLIDLDELIGEGLLTREEVLSCRWGERLNEIDYAKLFENRFRVLEQAFARFNQHKKEFRIFCEKENGWLEDYSFYMALKTFSDNRPWMEWEEGLRLREEKCCEEYGRKLSADITFWKFCQYEFFRQWMKLKQYAAARGIQIIGDMPLYLALDSADVWANRELFLLEGEKPLAVSGCPPDMYSSQGQKWGNPIYDWEEMEKQDFVWWKMRVTLADRMYDAFRLDHFIGVAKYYSIPADEDNAKNGRWMKGPGRKLTDAIEEAAGSCRIIMEDLGNNIPVVRKLAAKTGWPGMKVLLFAFDGNTANEYLPHNYSDTNLVLYAGTHDSETIVGHYRDKTEYELAYLYEYLGVSSKEEIPDALIRLAYSSIADVVIIQMQDILKLGNETRMNQPATVGVNWRWRVGSEKLSDERRSWLRTLSAIYRR